MNRILELQEIGLIDFWDTWVRPMPPKCINNLKIGYKPKKAADKIAPITLQNFYSAFVVLAVGLSLSFFVFLHEKLVFAFRT